MTYFHCPPPQKKINAGSLAMPTGQRHETQPWLLSNIRVIFWSFRTLRMASKGLCNVTKPRTQSNGNRAWGEKKRKSLHIKKLCHRQKLIILSDARRHPRVLSSVMIPNAVAGHNATTTARTAMACTGK